MLIGARNGMLVKSGWKNPYVTDGLVAMWDGEWNAGGGKHQSITTEWVDIAGGHNASNGANLVFNDKYLSGTDKLTAYNFNILPADPISIELAFYGSNKGLILENNNSNTGVYALRAGCDSADQYWGYRCGALVALWEYPRNFRQMTFIQEKVSNKYINSLYIKGAFRQQNEGNPSWGSVIDYINILTKNSVCCIRIYNRLLQDAEIDANWDIDYERFNTII